MIRFLLLITLFFIIYSEITVTNILFRPDSNNNISIHFSSLVSFMFHPLFNRTLWSWDTLDINFPFVFVYSFLMYHFYELLF